MNHRIRRLWIYGIVTLLIMVGIFLMSAQNGTESGNLSEWLLQTSFGRLLMRILPKITDAGVALDIRKYAHMAEYLLLAIFSCFFFRELFRETVPAIAAACCFGFCFLYACSDEFHQAFVPGRVGQFSDVLIDMIGVLLGVISVCLVYFMKERKLYE